MTKKPQSEICPSCGKQIGLPSKAVWTEHEGYLSFVLCKEPEALEKIQNKTHLCLACSMKILSEVLQLEIDFLNQVIGLNPEPEE